MYIRRTKYKNRTYYYLAKRQRGTDKEERLAVIGALTNPSPNKESQLINQWVLSLISGSENSIQKCHETEKKITASRQSELGRSFDLDKCVRELRAVYLKYGAISKTILDKKARPNGDLSYGVQTILKNLKRRDLSLKIVFEYVKDLDDSQKSELYLS